MMLARYTMYRRRPKDAGPLPDGIRQDSRWRTKHILRPTQEIVETYLEDTSAPGWETFRSLYLEILEDRYRENPKAFEKLAELASENDVYIGCSCPTQKNPDVRHCHTVLALKFMQEKFPAIEVRFPD
jgi:uncharacterized protein YeaO (DUF488 family)